MTIQEVFKNAGMGNEASQPDPTAAPFSTFISAVVSGNLSAAEALLADDIEWSLMLTGQKLKGKAEVKPGLRAGAASRKEPVTISDLAAKDWGIFKYWNIGVVTEELVAFGNQQKWPWPKRSKQSNWPKVQSGPVLRLASKCGWQDIFDEAVSRYR